MPDLGEASPCLRGASIGHLTHVVDLHLHSFLARLAIMQLSCLQLEGCSNGCRSADLMCRCTQHGRVVPKDLRHVGPELWTNGRHRAAQPACLERTHAAWFVHVLTC